MLNLVEEHYPLPDIHPQEKRKSAEKIADGSRKRKKKVRSSSLIHLCTLMEVLWMAASLYACYT